MQFEFDRPFIMDGAKFTRAFGGNRLPTAMPSVTPSRGSDTSFRPKPASRALFRITKATFVVCDCLPGGVPFSQLAPVNPWRRQRWRLGAVGQMELAENVANMAFHRLFAEDEPRSDVGVAQPFGDQSQYLPSALTQLRVVRHVMLSCTIKFLHDACGNVRMHHDLAARRFANGIGEIGKTDSLSK